MEVSAASAAGEPVRRRPQIEHATDGHAESDHGRVHQAHAAGDQRTLRGAAHERIKIALDYFVDGGGASADQADADQRVQQCPRQRRHARLGGCEIRACPRGHYDERGDPRFDEDGVVACERGKSFAWHSQRLRGAAHAVTAFRGAE